MQKNQNYELLLPVGNIDMCRAAVHNGADAIYVGMPYFNARGRTKDHALEELKEIIEFCHLYGVHVHVAFNIVIFQEEIERAKEELKKVIALGPDAFIVQDLGLVKMIKEIAPWQVVHASTQMTVTNADAIELLDDLNIKRFVLGRENSIPEIKKIKEATDKELEVFVHGALCVAYSGQCFTSETIGGRSANRGQCAQSCRFEYEMIVDGKKKNLIDQKYLVSPQDLCGISEIPALMDMGIESFKVEGRLKSPYFVASAASSYKAAMSNALDQNQVNDLKNKMGITYSRGFFSGWLHGVDHQELVDGTYGSNRGLKIGQVSNILQDSLLIKSDYKLDKGDGILFASFRGGKKVEIGAKIFDIQDLGDSTYKLYFSKEFKLNRVQKQDDIYINSSPSLYKEIEKSYSSKDLLKKIPITMKFKASPESPMTIELSDGENTVSIQSDITLEKANNPQKEEALKKALLGLSATAFSCSDLKLELSENPFIPNKLVKELRRKAIDKLIEKRITPKVFELKAHQLSEVKKSEALKENKLNILLRDITQVRALKELFLSHSNYLHHIESVIFDFEFSKFLDPALKELEEFSFKKAIATTRILKPGEYHHLKHIIRLNPDYILTRNLGAINFLQKEAPSIELRGDFSLNITNSMTADYLLSKGLKTITPSYDLNQNQLFDLATNLENNRLELTIHQYMPSFHMEHCVFAAFLSNGSSFKDCGKPCEEHSMELKDQFGNSHYIKVDQECRNTMFNATAQAATELLEKAKGLGVTTFRIEALHENSQDIKTKVLHYLKFFNGEYEMNELKENLNIMEKYGLSSGQLLKKDNYQDRKKDV